MTPPPLTRSFFHRVSARRPLALFSCAVVTLATALGGLVHAQNTKTVTVLLLDGKTGKPVIPSNLLVRIDHLDAIHSDWLQLNDDGSGQLTLPAGAAFLSIQGTYNKSTDLYINCDAGMEKDTRTIHWYSVADILASGVATPNECYKGKYVEQTHTTLKPGQFVVFVREANWRDASPD